MNTLLKDLLQWLQMNGYRRASFDRIVGIVPSASTYEQLTNLVNSYSHIFRHATMKGGLPGLALQDAVNISEALQNLAAPAPAAPATPSAPRVTLEQIRAEVHSVDYINAGEAVGSPMSPLGRVTLCVMLLRNGFTVIGKSACVSPELYDRVIGERLAEEDAIRQVWPLLGFRLADQLHANVVSANTILSQGPRF